MGDALIFCDTACLNMNMSRLFAKWMHDITDSQDECGSVGDVAPPVKRLTQRVGAAGWADAITAIPWASYLYHGDTRIIEDHWDARGDRVDHLFQGCHTSRTECFKKSGVGFSGKRQFAGMY